MAVRVFHMGANGYGLLTSAMAIGTIGGALFRASQDRASAGPHGRGRGAGTQLVREIKGWLRPE